MGSVQSCCGISIDSHRAQTTTLNEHVQSDTESDTEYRKFEIDHEELADCPHYSTPNKNVDLVNGYIRNIILDDVIPKEIGDIIVTHFNHHKFMDILIGKQPHSNLGTKENKKQIMPNNEIFKFNDQQCPHCDNNNSLEFITSYIESDKIGFCNVANEYQCKNCIYFIVHNVKNNVISDMEEDEYGNVFDHSITPFGNHEKLDGSMNINKHHIREFYCRECKHKLIELVYNEYKHGSSSIRYCFGCALFDRASEEYNGSF
eukprot:197344_1